MIDSSDDLENNRKLNVIEESINRALLYDNVNNNRNICDLTFKISMVIGGIIVVCLIIAIILLVYKIF